MKKTFFLFFFFYTISTQAMSQDFLAFDNNHKTVYLKESLTNNGQSIVNLFNTHECLGEPEIKSLVNKYYGKFWHYNYYGTSTIRPCIPFGYFSPVSKLEITQDNEVLVYPADTYEWLLKEYVNWGNINQIKINAGTTSCKKLITWRIPVPYLKHAKVEKHVFGISKDKLWVAIADNSACENERSFPKELTIKIYRLQSVCFPS